MIDKAMDILKSELNRYFFDKPGFSVTTSDVVLLSAVAKEDGSLAVPKEHVGLTLVNIEEERHNKAQIAYYNAPDGRVSRINPELRLNLFVLATANFSSYPAALKYLSGVVSFFQSKSVFAPQNAPGMDAAIEKIIVEMHTLGLEQMNHMWGFVGAKFIPSVLYRARLVVVQENLAGDDQAVVGQFEIRGKGA